MNCLLVDGEATARRMLAMHLEDDEDIVPVEDGERALSLSEARLTERNPPKLLHAREIPS